MVGKNIAKKGKTTKEKKVFEKFLTLLGFEYDRTGKHGEVWKHYAKNLTTQLPTTPSDNRWVKNLKGGLVKLVSGAFSKEDIAELLKPLIKKGKVSFTKDGRMRLLRIEGDLEMEFLRDLLIDDIPIHQELQEFEQGKRDVPFQPQDDFEFSDEVKTKIKELTKK